MRNNSIFENGEYLRLVTAAESLGCSSHELLHLGAVGKAEIIAPVLLTGTYEWPVAWDGIAYPELEPPFISDFDIRDRVVLFADDLKRIEAVGWATPRAFFSPTRGLEIAKHWCGDCFFVGESNLDSTITEDLVAMNKSYFPDLAIDMQSDACPAEIMPPEFSVRMQENAISVPWYLARPEISDENVEGLFDAKQNAEPLKTTAEHLFISNAEFKRLAANAPQDYETLKRQQAGAKSKKVHRNAERYSSNREQILAFAIYCKDKFPDICGDHATEWAIAIDEKALLRWKSGQPPLSRGQIENLLRNAMNDEFIIDDTTK